MRKAIGYFWLILIVFGFLIFGTGIINLLKGVMYGPKAKVYKYNFSEESDANKRISDIISEKALLEGMISDVELERVNNDIKIEELKEDIKSKEGFYSNLELADYIKEKLVVNKNILKLVKLEESERILRKDLKIIKISSPLLGFVCIVFGIALIFLSTTMTVSCMDEDTQRKYKNLGTAYTYISPAIMGMIILVFFPLVFGVWIAFTNYKRDILLDEAEFDGLNRFIDVFTSKNSDFWDIFFVNIWWTVINIFLSVSLGVILALILNRENMKFKKIYRTLLVLPWAVPSLVSALMWRSLFNKEFGAVNQILLPIYDFFRMEPLSWLSKSYVNLAPLREIPVLGPAIVNVIGLKGYLLSLPFASVVITNVWLGFPFMMIVALGGLQSISKTFYEAAEIDGATKWQQFWAITAPLLKPTMIPSIILSIIWTFNQFNVIYLVTTQDKMSILVVSAYREAFEKGKYSYAAAYSVVVFFILASYSLITMKISKATEEVY